MQRDLSFVLVVRLAVILSLTGCKAMKESSMENRTQTEQRIATLRLAYDAFNRGDMEVAVSSLDSKVEWTEPAEFPGGGTYLGPEAVKRYLTQSRAAWAECRSEPEQLIPIGDRVVVYVHARVRAKNSDTWQEVLLADVYTFHDDRVVQMRAFADRQDALRWAQATPSTR